MTVIFKLVTNNKTKWEYYGERILPFCRRNYHYAGHECRVVADFCTTYTAELYKKTVAITGDLDYK